MSLHGLGVIGAQVAASIKGSDDKHEKPASPRIRSPSCSVQSTPEVIHPQDFDPSVGAKPYSPFYKHGSPTISYEQLTYETKNNLTRSHLRDIENAGPYATLRTDSPRTIKALGARKAIWLMDEISEHSPTHGIEGGYCGGDCWKYDCYCPGNYGGSWWDGLEVVIIRGGHGGIVS
ncbi:hypothetical protein N7450_006767 [Penicillium hetheringtonii]|uniref:Uncharacterized protein n=1 Tax=Penicillium hetheringtonii TaxID=911720 RepID=A0AAD6GRA7_9EURO|nr:hypothetical protein N7450_006767 [Penicillium hetheringtonii]